MGANKRWRDPAKSNQPLNTKSLQRCRDSASRFVYLVPKKGLEPPHPCEYVDLNHARLPIPPLRHNGLQAGRQAVAQTIILQGVSLLSNQQKLRISAPLKRLTTRCA